MEGEPNEVGRLLCPAGCGFFGSWSTKGLCSLCYKRTQGASGGGQGPSALATTTVVNTSTINNNNNQCGGGLGRDSPTGQLLRSSSAFVSSESISSSGGALVGQLLPPEPQQVHGSDNGLLDFDVAKGLHPTFEHDPSLLKLSSETCISTNSIFSPATNASSVGNNEPSNSDSSSSPLTPSSDSSSDKKSKTNRCSSCRKKIGLTGFECRCGKMFCGLHRYSDTHECSFDYRQLGAEEIRKNNPLVVREKIKKI